MMLFPSVPKPSEKAVENKNVSVKGRTESESSWTGVTRGCSWQWVLCSVPGWEGHPHPGRVLLWKVANFSPGDSPKVSASLGSLPNGTPLPGRKPVCNPGFKRCFGVSWQKAAGDPNSKYRSKPIFFVTNTKHPYHVHLWEIGLFVREV